MIHKVTTYCIGVKRILIHCSGRNLRSSRKTLSYYNNPRRNNAADKVFRPPENRVNILRGGMPVNSIVVGGVHNDGCFANVGFKASLTPTICR